MEKPVMPSTERGNDENSFHVHYMQMQRHSMDSICSIYSLSSSSLPSQFRTITPKPEVHLTIERDGHKPPSSARTVYIILAAIFIVSSSIAVTIAVHEIQRVMQEESAAILTNYKYLNGTENEVTTFDDVITVTASQATKTTITPPPRPAFVDTRTHCFKRCTVYGKPKFESHCEAGFCVCEGKDFQENTCLPSVNGCVITKEIHSRSTSIWNSATAAFHCSSHIDSARDVYVIGIYGNHFSESTVVYVEGRAGISKPFTVVLGSHYPVRWKVKHRDLPISEIVLISDDKLSTSKVEVLNEVDVSSAISPTIRTEFLPVGYGDDRYHSNTAEMLENINQVVGPIKSFLGANFADKIVLKVTS